MRLYRPRFNQRQGTPDSELKPNPVRRYASCNCRLELPQDDDDLDDEETQRESVGWHELSLHLEVQDTSSDAWKSLEATSRRSVQMAARSLTRWMDWARKNGSR